MPRHNPDSAILTFNGKNKKEYNYIKIVHEGKDYITVKVGRHEVEIWDLRAILVIKKLLRRIKKYE